MMYLVIFAFLTLVSARDLRGNVDRAAPKRDRTLGLGRIPLPLNNYCRPGEKLCSDGRTCIPGLLLCDGVEDCPDGSDEKFGCENSRLCGENFYFCADRTSPPCVSRKVLCDGRFDCSDGSDESLCDACPENFCLNGGNCSVINHKPICKCTGDYMQNRCSRKKETEELDVDLGATPMQNPDLFGGDMLGVEVTDRNVIPHLHTRWTHKIVPYEIDSSVTAYSSLIADAMNEYNQKTCVKFVPRSGQQNYIRIFAGQGCYSNVGMIGGQQPVSLGQGCMFRGTIVHELGHALGFFHEQNRSDRDQFLTIYWQNIQNGMESQFFLLKSHENLLLSPFDFQSIMLYGNYAFSKDGTSKTMVAKNGIRLLEPYERQGMSQSDIQRVKKMYIC